MRMKAVLLGVLAGFALAVQVAPAGAVLFTGSGSSGGNNVSATANFTQSGTDLTIVLTNTSPANSLESPTSTLSGLTFQIDGQASALSHDSATAPSIFQGASCSPGPCSGSNVNVGGEWGYQLKSGTNLIGSAGYITTGLAHDLGNFNGANLDDPVSLDGINFGIISATHGALNGGLSGVPLVQTSLTLLLDNFNGSLIDIFNVNFLYGTTPETVIGGSCPPTDPTCNGGGGPPPPIPEPGTLFLLGSALLGYGAYRRRQRS